MNDPATIDAPQQTSHEQDGRTALAELLETTRTGVYRIYAHGSPFESKDVLRQRGYRWDPAERCWGRVVGETNLAEERQFLADTVYKGVPHHQEIEVS